MTPETEEDRRKNRLTPQPRLPAAAGSEERLYMQGCICVKGLTSGNPLKVVVGRLKEKVAPGIAT